MVTAAHSLRLLALARLVLDQEPGSESSELDFELVVELDEGSNSTFALADRSSKTSEGRVRASRSQVGGPNTELVTLGK